MKLLGEKGQFPRLFWIVNTLELRERGAYYGMLAMLPYHLGDTLHFETTAMGVLLGVLTPFLYLLPIASGALAQKYGFRPALLLAFVLIASGYAASGSMSTFETMLVAFILFGCGMGVFKPIISASIAHTTTEKSRNLGYSIYYWVINVGSFTFPLIISFAFPKELYGLVFFMSTGMIVANLVIALFFYKNPAAPDPTKSVAGVLSGAGLVLKDLRFVVLLLIYSGFWFVYSMNHLAILLYAIDFQVIDASVFPPTLIAVFNPGTIMIIGLFLGKIVEKYDSLRCMVVGITIVLLGFITLGATTNPAIFFAGIVIFSIGEFVTHPTYIAYVSKIAPKEKLAVYMGYAFIPPLIGLLSGNVVGAIMYKVMSEEMQRPKLFWNSVCAVGFLTIALLLLYSQTYGKKRREELADQAAETQRTEATAAGSSAQSVADIVSAPVPSHRFWDSKLPILAFLLVIPAIIGGAYGAGTDTYADRDGKEEVGAGSWSKYLPSNRSMPAYPGSSLENSDYMLFVEPEDANLVNITFTLRWTDEADMSRLGRTYENQPDEFGLEVSGPDGKKGSAPAKANTYGQEGSVSVTLSFEHKKPQKANATSVFNVTVKCGACGDFYPRFGVIGYTDTGNAWTLDVEYDYYARK